MQSVCPSCKNQIEHEDFLFEVVCDKCKSRFNPFMQQMEAPAAEIAGLTPAGGEPSQMEGLSSLESPAPSVDNFAESNAVFQELQQFGETLQEPPAAPAATFGGAAAGAKPAAAPRAATPIAVATDCAMTTGESLEGHTISGYLEPVSAWADLDAGGENPMKPAFDALATSAKSRGGNGLIGLHWVLSADGTKVLVSGVAVQVTKS